MVDFNDVHNPPPMSSFLVVFHFEEIGSSLLRFWNRFSSYYSFFFFHLSIINDHIGQIWCWYSVCLLSYGLHSTGGAY